MNFVFITLVVCCLQLRADSEFKMQNAHKKHRLCSIVLSIRKSSINLVSLYSELYIVDIEIVPIMS